MSCQNRGDERLEAALQRPAPRLGVVVQDALAAAVTTLAGVLPADMTERQFQQRVDELSHTIVGDVGERAMAKILAKAGHTIIMQSDRHVRLAAHRMPNDAVSIDKNGALIVHDVKATKSGRQNKRANEDGNRNLPKARLSRAKDGKQLSDPYNRVRMEEAIFFESGFADGEGPQAQVTRIDLRLGQYQTWEVDPNGRVGRSVDGPHSAALEIVEALAEVMRENDLPWP